jgi:hypothetical protein
VIAPVDWLCDLNAGGCQCFCGGGEIIAAHAEGMMSLAERIRDPSAALVGSRRGTSDAEQSEVLISALKQDLITEAGNHRETENVGVEAFGGGEIGDVDAEVIEALQFHDSMICSLSLCIRKREKVGMSVVVAMRRILA